MPSSYSDEYLKEYVNQLNEDDFEIKLERLRFLVDEFGEGHHMAFSQMAYYYFQEAKICYLNNAFIACVFISLAAIEDTIRGFLIFYLPFTDRTEKNLNEIRECRLVDLLKMAKSYDMLNDKEYQSLDKLRKVRNPYQHTKTPMDKRSILMRIAETDFQKCEFEIMKDDAELAIKTLFDFIDKDVFNTGSK
jgi:hypothetical protein